MAKLLLYVMWTVASLLITGVIIAADDRHPGVYHEHTDRQHFGLYVYIDDWTEHIDKHNYGYVLKRVKDVHIATYYAKLIFHLQLPDWQIEFRDVDHDCATESNVTYACRILRDVLEAVRHIRDKTQVFIQHQVRRIYEIVMDLPIHTGPRSRRGFMSDVLSHITGLATKDSVNVVVHVLRQIEAGIYESARFWGDGARSLTAAFRIQQDRMNNVFDILDTYRKTIRGIQDEFMATHDRSVSLQQRQSKALSSALYFLNNNTIQLQEMESLYNGIETLMAGRISHYLLPHDYLQRALAHVASYLHVQQ